VKIDVKGGEKMYKFVLAEVPNVQAVLDQAVKDGYKLFCSFYCSDSQQVGLVFQVKSG
jgi:hypothetical protein